MKKSMPIVAIVGRTNVGKSTLFNRLSESVKSMTLDYEGVTRDVITDEVCWRDTCFELADTGGISLRKIVDDPIAEIARTRAFKVVENAALVLFVCDGTVGITQEDRELAKLLHKLDKRVVLVVNKIDTSVAQAQMYEFERLGFTPLITISAQHGIGISDLFEAILEQLPEHTSQDMKEEPICKVVILGKPNVGKSSLMNLLLKKERSIVADMPGTTREPIREQVRFYQESIQLTDTPGVRRKRGVTEPIEKLMVKSALRTVDDADIVLLMIDASQVRMVDQELKLAFYVFEEHYKGLIILFNKDDLLDDEARAQLEFNLEPYEYFLKKVVQMKLSCVSQKNVGKLMQAVSDLCKRYTQRFEDQELTTMFKEALERTPLYKSERRLVLYYAKQVKTRPISIELRVSEPHLFGPSQVAFFDNVLRKHADLKGVPVQFFVRKK